MTVERCTLHDWDLGNDGCPVCLGIRMEQDRIVGLLLDPDYRESGDFSELAMAIYSFVCFHHEPSLYEALTLLKNKHVEYDPKVHWINDPIIESNTRIAMFEDILALAERDAAFQTRLRISKLLQQANSGKTHSVDRYCGLCHALELIEGETK